MKKILCISIAVIICLVCISIIVPNKENNQEPKPNNQEILLEAIKTQNNQIIKVYEDFNGYELYYNCIDDVKVAIGKSEYYLKDALEKNIITIQDVIKDVESVYRKENEYAIIVNNKKVYICSHLISQNSINENLTWKIEDLTKTDLTFIINNSQKRSYGLKWYLQKKNEDGKWEKYIDLPTELVSVTPENNEFRMPAKFGTELDEGEYRFLYVLDTGNIGIEFEI